MSSVRGAMMDSQVIKQRAGVFFDQHRRKIAISTDRMFALLMVFQWVGGIVAAAVVSPRAWEGSVSGVQVHVWSALVCGGVLSGLPIMLALRRPGAVLTRNTIAVAQMLWSTLLIHLTGGRIETHIHLFVSLAFLSFYRDWKVFVPATVVVTVDHAVRGVFWPQSVYGVLLASPWRTVEHIGWVLFEVGFLVRSCLLGVSEMRDTAMQRAQLQGAKEVTEQEVQSRTSALEAANFSLEQEIDRRRSVEQALRDAERKSRMLLDGSPVCNKIIDLDYRLQYMSAAGKNRLKICNIEDHYGSFYPDIFPESMRATVIEHLDRAKAGEVTDMEGPVLDMDGREVWYHATFVPVHDNDERVEYIIVASVEITERRRVEEDLLRAKEVAEAATHAKSDFLANMSHEIRTPMTAILGYADVLLELSKSEGVASEQFNAAQTIKKNGEYLIGIINDILDLSKVESGMMAMERIVCNPCRVVAEVASLVKIKADGKNLSFGVEYIGSIPEAIETDPTRLRQILINLIGNAIKFTEVGGVRLIVRCLEEDGRSVMRFEVRDTGIGMTQEQVSRLFLPFTQADASTTRRFGGTGLGLTISKRFAEMLGGDLVVVDTGEGVGTCFGLTVATGQLDGVEMIDDPMTATVISSEDMVAGHDEPGLEGCRVLLAEDGPDNQRLIAHLLKKAGAVVTVKENGKLAVEAALGSRDGRGDVEGFDVVLMDMQMPVMDGYEAAGLLRREGYVGAIIALTAHAMEGDRQKCIEAGCDGYATKPIHRQQLIETIRGQLRRAEVPVTH